MSALQRGDLVSLTTLVLAIAKKEPRFSFTKSVTANGKELSWALDITNTGDDAANEVTVTDVIPTGTTYVGDSAQSDAANTTQYDPASRTLTVKFDAAIAPEAKRRISFRTTIDGGFAGTLSNQAQLSSRGIVVRSDGDPATAGAQATVFTVGATAQAREPPPANSGCASMSGSLWFLAVLLFRRRIHTRTNNH